MNTVASLLQQAEQTLQQNPAQADDAAIDARLLLGHLLQKSSAWLATWPEQTVANTIAEQYQQLLGQRQIGTPTAYLLGEWDFMDFTVQVGPGVLVPRPDTELLVELAAERIPTQANWQLLDLGTGTGAIAIALARLRPHCNVVAVEQSQTALDIAQNNIDKLAPTIQLHWGSWFEPIASSQQFEIIVSNPPYIGDQEPELAQLIEEPLEALVAANDGLADLTNIIAGATQHLKKAGWLLVEHGYQQGPACRDLFNNAGYSDIETVNDLAGKPRVTLGRWA